MSTLSKAEIKKIESAIDTDKGRVNYKTYLRQLIDHIHEIEEPQEPSKPFAPRQVTIVPGTMSKN